MEGNDNQAFNYIIIIIIHYWLEYAIISASIQKHKTNVLAIHI